MALVRVACSDGDRTGNNVEANDVRELFKGEKKPIIPVCSLPALSTHKVSLERRAGYKYYGESPEELKQRMAPKSDSGTLVEPFLAKRATNHLAVAPPVEEDGIPESVTWSAFRVCDWIRAIGYPQYVDCFRFNFINGRKLIYFCETKHLVKLGITDFDHLKAIAAAIRRLIGVTKAPLHQYQNYSGLRSISLPPDVMYNEYLRKRARTVKKSKIPTLQEYSEQYKQQYDRARDLPTTERKWRKHLTI